jgi:hypothetical protein
VDANADGSLASIDALFILRYLFERGPEPEECR